MRLSSFPLCHSQGQRQTLLLQVSFANPVLPARLPVLTLLMPMLLPSCPLFLTSCLQYSYGCSYPCSLLKNKQTTFGFIWLLDYHSLFSCSSSPHSLLFNCCLEFLSSAYLKLPLIWLLPLHTQLLCQNFQYPLPGIMNIASFPACQNYQSGSFGYFALLWFPRLPCQSHLLTAPAVHPLPNFQWDCKGTKSLKLGKSSSGIQKVSLKYSVPMKLTRFLIRSKNLLPCLSLVLVHIQTLRCSKNVCI